MTHVMWFRRDLRAGDNGALAQAAAAAGTEPILPLFIVDPNAWDVTPATIRAHVTAALAALATDLGGMHVRMGDPAEVLAALAGEVGPLVVHASEEFTPAERARDDRVAEALASLGSTLNRTDSPYAVAPGTVRKPDGTTYRVFTPFLRAWLEVGWPAPISRPGHVGVLDLPGGLDLGQLSTAPGSGGTAQGGAAPSRTPAPAAGERAALARWARFVGDDLADYGTHRDRPDLDATSRMSIPLRWGEVHPRTLLASLDPDRDTRFVAELAWREFYADVLMHNPATLTANLNPSFDRIAVDSGPGADEAFDAWAAGRTGFPLVDAGMRQLRAEGWMHNRVRMVTASFLVKDLHLPWWRGEREFMRWLLDGDPASNAHGWQWVAGCGTDAAPYYRIFNPVRQGLSFDPDGAYVRRYVPELAHLPGALAHEPWRVADGYAHGYPRRIVDHAAEREEALTRYQAIR